MTTHRLRGLELDRFGHAQRRGTQHHVVGPQSKPSHTEGGHCGQQLVRKQALARRIAIGLLGELESGLAGDFKHLRGRWPVGRVALQHLAHEASELRRVAVAHRIILARGDALAQHVEVDLLAVEWRAQLGHLIEEAAERPEVRLEVVAHLALDALGRHVVGRADGAVHHVGLRREVPPHAEVAQLDVVGLGHEDVGLGCTAEAAPA
eukprot:scaffold54942_cov75-Phaeocystis_antarctica.AAC.7